MKIRLTPALIVGTLLLAPGGCKPQARTGFQRTADRLPPGVAVRVDGFDITEEQVVKEMGAMMTQLNRDYADRLHDGEYDHARRVIRGRAIENLIAMHLIGREMHKHNIVITPERIDRHVEQSAADNGMTLDDLIALVTSRDGMTFEDWKAQMQYDKRLGALELVKRLYPDDLEVTEARVRAYYDEHTPLFEKPEMVRASHILIRSDAAAGQTDEVARAKAERLLSELRGGADFEKLAREHSDCPSAENGGDLGFAPAGAWVPEFSEAAFALQVGQISDVVVTPYGCHIIRLTDRQAAARLPYEEVRDEIIKRLSDRRQSRLRQQYLLSLYEAAQIEYAPGNLITMVPLLTL